VRAADRTITTFEAPRAGTGPVEGTYAWSINSRRKITGYYQDASFVIHAFLRSSDGTFITWDAPGATQTFAQAMNAAGTIAGSYLDAASVYHGYRRSRDGSFTVFDGPPGNTIVLPLTINSAGTITGLS
jgi:hypothetical protein